MPFRVLEFQETPNPDALKIVLDPPPPPLASTGIRSYTAPGAAAADPLAAGLLAIPGVRSVLIVKNWVTVNKKPEADWKSLRAALKRAIENSP